MEAAMAVSAERLESQLLKVQRTIDEDAAAGIAMGYALIIDGKALLYALSPRLRQLFLQVHALLVQPVAAHVQACMYWLQLAATRQAACLHCSARPVTHAARRPAVLAAAAALACPQVGIKCAAVLCCRVSPLQKAQVTALVKSWGDTTLAIGDGANDVGMIQKAHIGACRAAAGGCWRLGGGSACCCLGDARCTCALSLLPAPPTWPSVCARNNRRCTARRVRLCPSPLTVRACFRPRPRAGVGISGQEGMQAAMAADFAIAQFRFLTPLLLVHGRLSYKRITRMISFFFYKNLFYGSTIFVYNAFALFSGQPIYNDFYMTLFNVVFTAAAPLVVGWFDRDLEKQYSMRFPFLYREGAWLAGRACIGRSAYTLQRMLLRRMRRIACPCIGQPGEPGKLYACSRSRSSLGPAEQQPWPLLLLTGAAAAAGRPQRRLPPTHRPAELVLRPARHRWLAGDRAAARSAGGGDGDDGRRRARQRPQQRAALVAAAERRAHVQHRHHHRAPAAGDDHRLMDVDAPRRHLGLHRCAAAPAGAAAGVPRMHAPVCSTCGAAGQLLAPRPPPPPAPLACRRRRSNPCPPLSPTPLSLLLQCSGSCSWSRTAHSP